MRTWKVCIVEAERSGQLDVILPRGEEDLHKMKTGMSIRFGIFEVVLFTSCVRNFRLILVPRVWDITLEGTLVFLC